MGVEIFNIILDNVENPAVYHPGELICGRVVICLNRPKNLRGVTISIKGKAKVRWSESRLVTNSNDPSSTTGTTYYGEDIYDILQCYVFGNGEEFTLPAGNHVYPFHVILPHDIPSSFVGEFGYIKYKIKSRIDIVWAFDKKVAVEFTVVNLLDLNDDPLWKLPITDEDHKTFCFLLCVNGPLFLSAQLPKRGYAFGETIPVMVDARNQSNIEARVSCSIVQVITWISTKPRKERHSKNHLGYASLGCVRPRTSTTWSKDIQIPSTPAPYLAVCRVIKVTYYLKVVADPDGPHADLELRMPIQLGNVPIRDEDSVFGGSLADEPILPVITPSRPVTPPPPYDSIFTSSNEESSSNPPSYPICGTLTLMTSAT